MSNTILILGLGNPTPKYQNTKHNVGFMVADSLSRLLNASFTSSKFNAEVSSVTQKFGDKPVKIILAKPQTYMNLSGDAARALTDYYKIPPQNILVVYDDVSLPPNSIRLRNDGSAGGHNGVRDIILKLNTDQFPRLKVGIGDNGVIPLADYVLGKYTPPTLSDKTNFIDNVAKYTMQLIKNKVEKGLFGDNDTQVFKTD
ncbi:MAG: aminoacyl-tRNA hydrolase [Clostridiales bacterium]|jgi:PTH1 family peptidyl-tRNA hydrolase|nr:aminoacyl-tRNA hydrolase [Clostridiales bacterium]